MTTGHRPAPDWFWVWVALVWFLFCLGLFGALFYRLVTEGFG